MPSFSATYSHFFSTRGDVPASGRRRRTAPALCVNASSQCFHQIDDFGWRTLSWDFDLLAGLLLPQQLLQRIFVVVLEFLGLKVSGLAFDDV